MNEVTDFFENGAIIAPSTTQQQTNKMENLDSALLQYVKAEITKVTEARKALTHVDTSVMPPAERRERVAALEREAALVKQLTFNLKMAEEMQSLRDLILGISVESDSDSYDDSEFDATQMIADSIQEEVTRIAAHPNLSPANPHRIAPTESTEHDDTGVTEESRVSKLITRLTDTKLKIAGLVTVGTVVTLITIAATPAEYKSWIFPLLNALGT